MTSIGKEGAHFDVEDEVIPVDVTGRRCLQAGRPPAIHGVLVTYRRPNALEVVLDRIARQTRCLDRLVVVDNAATPDNERIVSGSGAARDLVYVAPPENIGPAGGIAKALQLILVDAGSEDWVALFDDDNPPTAHDLVETLFDFGLRCWTRDPATAGVGLVGARFDPIRGRILRVRDEELTGAVPVHYLGGGQLPLYRIAAIREVGSFRSELFFGFEELEFGWRLARAGYNLYVPGELWKRGRERYHRLGLSGRPQLVLTGAPWRRYYSIRNLIHILRTNGRHLAAARIAVMALMKVAVNLTIQPHVGAQHLLLTLRACRDGWRGKLGRTIEPIIIDSVGTKVGLTKEDA